MTEQTFDITEALEHLCPLTGTTEDIAKGEKKRESWVIDMLADQEKDSRACKHSPERIFEEVQALIRWTNCDTNAARWASSDFRSLYGNFKAHKHPFLGRMDPEYISPYDLRGWGEDKAGVLVNAITRSHFSRW